MKKSVLEKSLDFTLRIILLLQLVCEVKDEYVIAKQILGSSTRISANIPESYFGLSKEDVISKLSIALKDWEEARYRLKLLSRSKIINKQTFDSTFTDCEELGKMLTASIQAAKQNQPQD